MTTLAINVITAELFFLLPVSSKSYEKCSHWYGQDHQHWQECLLYLLSAAPAQPMAKASMSAACQASVDAFVSAAQQQLPALAQGLLSHRLQDFLCELHTRRHVLQASGHHGTANVVEVRLAAAGQGRAGQGCITLTSLHRALPHLTLPCLSLLPPHNTTSPHLPPPPTPPHLTPPHLSLHVLSLTLPDVSSCPL